MASTQEHVLVTPHSSKAAGQLPRTWAQIAPEEKHAVPIKTFLSGPSLLTCPQLNKGSGFSRAERALFGLDSLLPHAVDTLEEQAARAWDQCRAQKSTELKHAFLQALRDQNQVLFYRVMVEHIEELLGVLYTPGVGEAVQEYSHMFKRPIGCFLTPPDLSDAKDAGKRMEELLLAHVIRGPQPVQNYDFKAELDLIVVTDSEAILGIGDQGVGGVNIATSKAALYTIGAGVDPNRILSVVLDVGTDNERLLRDAMYLGWRRARLRGKEYDEFVDCFIRTARRLFPYAVIHFEDFGLANAHRLLARYRPRMPMFNDDIQGTGAVTLAAIVAALKVTKQALADQRVLVYGAGSAGIGIADMVADDLVVHGLAREDANQRIWAVDRHGLLTEGMELSDSQAPYARKRAEVQDWSGTDLLQTVKHVKPTILVGTSTVSRAFNEEVVKAMAAGCGRPLIFPMSNPTRLSEADPADVMKWTDGKALMATGSPFPPVEVNGTKHVIAQTNNALIFPALGLAAAIARSNTISTPMIMAAVHALAGLSPALKDETASLLPPLDGLRDVSVAVAAAVVRQAVEEGNAEDDLAAKIVRGEGELTQEDFIRANMWDPVYRPLELVSEDEAYGSPKP